MAGSWLDWLADRLSNAAAERGELVFELLISPGSPYSLIAIAICTAIAAATILSGRKPGREVRLKVLLRAIFPRRIYRSASGRADLVFTFFSIFLWFMLFGWAIVSAQEVARLTGQTLAALLGPQPPSRLPVLVCSILMTLTLFLAFELGYWIDHYLAHKIPFRWVFHKVHHCAESLSPLTVFRVHPVDTLIFYNILAVTMGLAQGMLAYGLGGEVNEIVLGGMNVLLLATGIVLVHLQHSHFWVSFSGPLGRVFLSPAHHQIHHSADPAHYGRNFGGSLAIWDRLFGTLHTPAKERGELRFGVPELDYDPHTIRAGFFVPFKEAGEILVPHLSRGRRAEKMEHIRNAAV